MKKWWIVIIIGIFVLIVLLIAFFIYYNFYYPYTGNPYSGNAPPITEEELKCGAYFGDYNQKKPGTPDNWVLAAKGTMSSAWVDPNNPHSPFDCHE